MALTRDRINDLAEDGVFLGNVYEIAQAIEAEVRKQDEALILQLVERLERSDKISGYPNNREAIKAGRARLEGKTCA